MENLSIILFLTVWLLSLSLSSCSWFSPPAMFSSKKRSNKNLSLASPRRKQCNISMTPRERGETRELSNDDDNEIPPGVIRFFAEVAEGCTKLDDDFVWEIKVDALGLDLVQDKAKLVVLCSKIGKSLPDMTSQVISCSEPYEEFWRKVVIRRSGTFSGEPLVLGNMPALQPTGKFVTMPLEEHWVLLDRSSGEVIRAKTTAQNPTLYDALTTG
jgi:hypothetical protein